MKALMTPDLRDGEMARWRDGEMARWRDGEMVLPE